MSIRDQLASYARWKWFGLKTPIGDHKLAGAVEDMCREIYNWGPETITFVSNHPLRAKMWFHGHSPKYWSRLECKAGEWVFLPHGMYIPFVPSGSQEIKVTVNMGDNMFIGNKHASRPEATKVRSFVPGMKTK